MTRVKKALTRRFYLVSSAKQLGEFGRKVTNARRSVEMAPPCKAGNWTEKQWALYYRVLNVPCGKGIELTSHEIGQLGKMAVKVI